MLYSTLLFHIYIFATMEPMRIILSFLITISVVFGSAFGIRKECNQSSCLHIPPEIHHSCSGTGLQFLDSQVAVPRYSDPFIAISADLQWNEPTVQWAPFVIDGAYEWLVSQKVSTVSRHIASTVILS